MSLIVIIFQRNRTKKKYDICRHTEGDVFWITGSHFCGSWEVPQFALYKLEIHEIQWCGFSSSSRVWELTIKYSSSSPRLENRILMSEKSTWIWHRHICTHAHINIHSAEFLSFNFFFYLDSQGIGLYICMLMRIFLFIYLWI
jgi:hypothetical protein